MHTDKQIHAQSIFTHYHRATPKIFQLTTSNMNNIILFIINIHTHIHNRLHTHTHTHTRAHTHTRYTSNQPQVFNNNKQTQKPAMQDLTQGPAPWNCGSRHGGCPHFSRFITHTLGSWMSVLVWWRMILLENQMYLIHSHVASQLSKQLCKINNSST